MTKQQTRDYSEIERILAAYPNREACFNRLMFVADSTPKAGTRIRFTEAARNLYRGS